MNSTQVFELIEKIAATSSKTEKLALLKTGFDADTDGWLKYVCEQAYSPFVVFNIGSKKLQTVVGQSFAFTLHEFNDDTKKLLDDIASARITGDMALEAIGVELAGLTQESAALLRRVLLKDLRAGFSESTINKARKGLIPVFPYMRCSLPKDADLDSWPWEDGVFSQEKADGMFCNANRSAAGVWLTSRQGTPLSAAALGLVEALQGLPMDHQSHGELEVLQDGKVLPREIGNGILNKIADGEAELAPGQTVRLSLWDSIPLSSVVPKGACETPYIERLFSLIKTIKAANHPQLRVVPTRIVKTQAAMKKHFAELLAAGKEGTVVKHPQMPWKDGTSKFQVKNKLTFEVDLIVKGIEPGEAYTKNEGRAGSLRCESSDGLLKVNVNVKNEDMRDRVDANNEDWIDRIVTVVANGILKPSESSEFYSLFLPRMAEADYRRDKTEADSLVRVIEQYNAAVGYQAFEVSTKQEEEATS